MASNQITRRSFIHLVEGTGALLAPAALLSLAGCSASPASAGTAGSTTSTAASTSTPATAQEESEPEEPSIPGLDPKDSLEDYTWDEIATIAQAIAAADSDEDGVALARAYNITGTATKTFTLGGKQTATAIIAGFRHDDKTDGSGKAGITFLVKDTGCTTMYSTADGTSWSHSDLRSFLTNKVLGEYMPQEIAEHILEVGKITDTNYTSTDPSNCTPVPDRVWPFSLVEIVGTRRTYLSDKYKEYDGMLKAEGTQYPLFRDPEASDNPSPSETGVTSHDVEFQVFQASNSYMNEIMPRKGEKPFGGKQVSDGFWLRSAYPYKAQGALAYCLSQGEKEADFCSIQQYAKVGVIFGFCM